VLTLAGDRFVALDRFDAAVFRSFGLPRRMRFFAKGNRGI
jgi:hypothetical protein